MSSHMFKMGTIVPKGNRCTEPVRYPLVKKMLDVHECDDGTYPGVERGRGRETRRRRRGGDRPRFRISTGTERAVVRSVRTSVIRKHDVDNEVVSLFTTEDAVSTSCLVSTGQETTTPRRLRRPPDEV